ncbi:membrane protein [Oxalicibacterium flavum]|uniref:Membrane protein n=1 Tax=Oxalicibacterium flavum TaxID=179467 RepID=A0A8J2XUP4_9BURK|nr:prepilin peptidase [Oxalicibacterium flavum]GGB97789.1 membrane protein [Oxalicibacterium flavum]
MMTVLVISLCAAVIIYDLLFRRVPNWLLLAAFMSHVGWLVVMGNGLNGIDIWQSLIGGFVGLVLFLPFYALHAMGAGDVKFFALLGLMMGVSALLPIWLIGSVIAGLHAVAWHVASRQLVMLPAWNLLTDKVTGNSWYQAMLKNRKGRRGIPYAAYLAIGAIAISTTRTVFAQG